MNKTNSAFTSIILIIVIGLCCIALLGAMVIIANKLADKYQAATGNNANKIAELRTDCYKHYGNWVKEDQYNISGGKAKQTVYRCIIELRDGEDESKVFDTSGIEPPTTEIPATSTLKELGSPVKLKDE